MTHRSKENSQKVEKWMKKPWVRFIIYTIGFWGAYLIFVLISYLLKKYVGEYEILQKFESFVDDKLSISVFAGYLLAILQDVIITAISKRKEEWLKIEDDQRKIINKYSGHKKDQPIIKEENYFNFDGTYMAMHSKSPSSKALKPEVKDKKTDDYKKQLKAIQSYQNNPSTLYIPSLNVYCNMNKNTHLEVDDHTSLFELRDFIVQNSMTLLKAHAHSKKSNTLTIRLNDYQADLRNKEKPILHLTTARTNYYQMLLTNRCMDYKLTDGMTVRDVYEYKKLISPLKESNLSNQIGINGLVITKDNYLLIEHRSLKKTTWKDKFAQPISLALKCKDLFSTKEEIDGKVQLTNDNVEQKLIEVIKKTLLHNFGLQEGIDYELKDFSKTFMGLARDLLEGGKPNLYFIVNVNDDASQFATKLQQLANKPYLENGEEKYISKDKIQNKYYLMKYDDINYSFDYEITMPNNKKVYKVVRKYEKKINQNARANDEIHYLKHKKTKECGEALLCSLAYYELIKDRWLEVDKKGMEQ